MAIWSVTISTSAEGVTRFSPDPLDVSVSDEVSWANRTDQVHRLAISGVTFTEPIEPFKSSRPAYVCQGTPGTVIPYSCVIEGHTETGTIRIVALLLCALLLGLFGSPAAAQPSTAPIDCGPIIGKELQAISEIDARTNNILRGTLVTAGANLRMPIVKGQRQAGSLLKADGTVDPTRIECRQQWSRIYSKDQPRGRQDENAPVIDPLPGPTLRARVGDLIQLTFLNLIDPLNFPDADDGKCDETSTVVGGQVKKIYPTKDKYPDCFNESIITNIHFHGTHTNPSSTGDNVFLQIKPSPRAANTGRKPAIDADSVQATFAEFFRQCERQLPSASVPKQWPRLWADATKTFRAWTDLTTALYAEEWYEQNQNAIANGAWPQNYVGAFPYCFRLPDYTPTTWPPKPQTHATSAHMDGAGAAEKDETQAPVRPLMMGQAPGTHWYHAHKHGSTTINVSNGMTGVFVIEGKYDDEIKAGYPRGIKQQVLVIQQLDPIINLERGIRGADPYFSVNGQLQPVITMQPGEVQWWRIANTSGRAGAYFLAPADVKWKQLAQDGVQFNDANYQASNSDPFLLASGNRADLLVQAPAAAGTYPLLVYNMVDPSNILPARNPVKLTLLNVKVTGAAANMSFLPNAPSFPPYLADIPDASSKERIHATREMVFASSSTTTFDDPAMHTIDGKLFDGEVGATVVLNQTEEWKVVNETYPNATGRGNRIAHPFHIHINPFQVVEVFDPNATIGTTTTPRYVTSNPQAGQCLIDLAKKETWKPCADVPKPRNIWWDVFPIPSGALFDDGAGNKIKVPGYFKLRSRFVDYAGYYVLHCHILAHEDRGMMTVVYVTPLQPPFSHH